MRVTREFSSAFAKVVQRHRERKKLSLARLAELSGISQTYPGKLVRGAASPTLDVSFAISRALDIPLSRLVKEAEALTGQNKK